MSDCIHCDKGVPRDRDGWHKHLYSGGYIKCPLWTPAGTYRDATGELVLPATPPSSKEQLTVDQAVGMLVRCSGYVLPKDKADQLIEYIRTLDRRADEAPGEPDLVPDAFKFTYEVVSAPASMHITHDGNGLIGGAPETTAPRCTCDADCWNPNCPVHAPAVKVATDPAKRCQHDLLKPACTVTVSADHRGGRCVVCLESWRLSDDGLAVKTSAPICPKCKTELAFDGDVCGLCNPVAQP